MCFSFCGGKGVGCCLKSGASSGDADPGTAELHPVEVEEVVAGPTRRRPEDQEELGEPPGSVIGKVWLAYVVASAVAAMVTVVSRGPSTASRWTSAMPVPPDVRNVSELMLTRLNGPLSCDPVAVARGRRAAVRRRRPRSPPCWCRTGRRRTRPPAASAGSAPGPTVVRAGTPPAPAEVGVRRADHAEHVAAVRDVVDGRRQHAGAAVDRRLRVAVRVVAEDEGHLDPAAVDRPVLRVGHRHRRTGWCHRRRRCRRRPGS